MDWRGRHFGSTLDGSDCYKKKKRAAMWFDEAGLVASIFGIDREIIVCIILLWRMFVSRYARI